MCILFLKTCLLAPIHITWCLLLPTLPPKSKLEKCSDPVSLVCYYELKIKACIIKPLAASITLPFPNVFNSPFHALAQACLLDALQLQLCALVLTNLSNKLKGKEISRKMFSYGKQKMKKKKKKIWFFFNRPNRFANISSSRQLPSTGKVILVITCNY